MATEKQKFVRMFGRREVYLTACAVIKDPIDSMYLSDVITTPGVLNGYTSEPNQFWQRDPKHERALLKVYRKNLGESLTCWVSALKIVKIPMPFLGHDSNAGWGELQFLIKAPSLVKLARHRSFDTRVNQWVPETKPIQPKTDLETHAYLALRFYHQDYLPPVPDDWHFEPVYVSVKNMAFYRIDVLWENEEIKIATTALEKDSPEIPKHLK